MGPPVLEIERRDVSLPGCPRGVSITLSTLWWTGTTDVETGGSKCSFRLKLPVPHHSTTPTDWYPLVPGVRTDTTFTPTTVEDEVKRVPSPTEGVPVVEEK